MSTLRMSSNSKSVVSKVSSREEVESIFRANKLLVKLQADWLKAVVSRDNVTAARIRRQINSIKGNFLQQYDIIL